MRKFNMYRTNDETGVSGTGCIIEGAEFTDGTIVVKWLNSLSSIGIYKNLDEFLRIHVVSHPSNGTRIIFDDGYVFVQ